MNVLCSTPVAGTSTPPPWLFLQSGHALDVARCLLEEPEALQALFTACCCSLIFKLSGNSCAGIACGYQLCQNPLDGCFSELTQILSAVLAPGLHKTQ